MYIHEILNHIEHEIRATLDDMLDSPEDYGLENDPYVIGLGSFEDLNRDALIYQQYCIFKIFI